MFCKFFCSTSAATPAILVLLSTQVQAQEECYEESDLVGGPMESGKMFSDMDALLERFEVEEFQDDTDQSDPFFKYLKPVSIQVCLRQGFDWIDSVSMNVGVFNQEIFSYDRTLKTIGKRYWDEELQSEECNEYDLNPKEFVIKEVEIGYLE